MSAVNKIEAETEVKTNANKTFRLIKHDLHNLPKIFPEVYKGSEIIEGDGTKNGCVRTWHYVLPGSEEVLMVKCKNEDLEDEKMTIALKVIDGDILKYYKIFIARITVVPQGKGCLVKWCVEFEKLNDDVTDPHHYLELFVAINKKLEAHLLENE